MRSQGVTERAEERLPRFGGSTPIRLGGERQKKPYIALDCYDPKIRYRGKGVGAPQYRKGLDEPSTTHQTSWYLHQGESAVRIHPSAVVDPAAILADDVQIGALSVVEGDVVIGEGCQILHHVVIKNGTSLGPGNTVCDGAVLGGLPQHVHIPERPGRLVVGTGNMIREAVTFHRAMEEGHTTVIGDHNLFMVNTHIAHDCRVGNHTIFANNSMLAGHVSVADRAFVSGAAAAHQFCRIGTLAMVGGQAHVNKDVPPFVTLDGLSSHVVGLNTIGLRRAGLTSDDICQLKQAYRIIYRSALSWNDILQRLQDEFQEGYAAQYYPFLSATTRGIMSERRLPPGAVVRLRDEEEIQPHLHTRAG